MDYIGYSFQPGQDQRMRQSLNQGGSLSPLASDALRVLSLRLPTVLGGRPVAPTDLLKPGVGGTPTNSAVAETMARVNGGAPATPAPAPLTGAGPVTSPITTSTFSPSPMTPISRPAGSGSPLGGNPTAAPAPMSGPSAASAPSSPFGGGGGRPGRPDAGGDPGGGLSNLGILMSQMLSNPNFSVYKPGGGFGPFDSFGNYIPGGGGGGRGSDFGGPQLG